MGFFSKKTEAVPDAGQMSQAVLPDGTQHLIKQKINCLGDSCPRPQLMTKKALSTAMPGDVIEILIDNATSMEAIPPMMKDLRSSHLATVRADRCWHVYVRKD